MFAALPPSSSVSALSVPAIARWIRLPISVEPVNATLATSLWVARCMPISPGPVTMLTTPGGRSAWRHTSANRSADSGVVEAGLRTTVLPAASAGAIFHASISSGKFHGMICAATPSGLRDAARERVLELVRPARVVPEVRRGERDVDVAALLDRLARVHRLEDGELAAPLLEDPGDPEEVLRALLARQVGPRPAPGAHGGCDGPVDVRGRRLRDPGERQLGRRIDARERAAVGGVDGSGRR